MTAPHPTGVAAKDYTPQDSLYLFWLQSPARPQAVGTLNLNPRLKSATFEYTSSWLRTGQALSPDLPLHAGVFTPEAEHLPGAIDDARPDRWGERVIRHIDAPSRLSILEYLFFAGDDRFGALGVSCAEDRYWPCVHGPAPHLSALPTIYELVQAVQSGQKVDPHLARLIKPGATLGGAKPKALLNLGGQTHIVKFPERDEVFDVGLIEHATMTLAAQAGLNPARTQAIPLGTAGPHALAVQRFDRYTHGPNGAQVRHHALSMRSALRAVQNDFSYANLALYVRRFAPAQEAQAMADMLFRRMVFNILIDNTDDHEKNHALVHTDGAGPRLSPAYDLVPTCQNLGYQQIGVGVYGAASTLENALSAHKAFRLGLADARRLVREVATVVHGWRAHFEALQVGTNDIEVLSASLDRPFLLDQRLWAMR